MKAVVCVGSNCGCRRENVEKAVVWLGSLLSGMESSGVYSTMDEPVLSDKRLSGCASDSYGEYINCVVAGEFAGDGESLRQLCKEYELSNGRDIACRLRGEVPVDIDIVVADGDILRVRDWNSCYFQKGYRRIFQDLVAR